MQVQKIKSALVFLFIIVLVFYTANRLSREAEVSFEMQQERSSQFLVLVETLNAIEFDLAFIIADTGNTVVTNPFVLQVPTGGVGRDNPFSSISRPLLRPEDFSSSDASDSFPVLPFEGTEEITIVDSPEGTLGPEYTDAAGVPVEDDSAVLVR